MGLGAMYSSIESPMDGPDELRRKTINLAIEQIQSSGWPLEVVNMAIARLGSMSMENIQDPTVLVSQVVAQVAADMPAQSWGSLSSSAADYADYNDGSSGGSNGSGGSDSGYDTSHPEYSASTKAFFSKQSQENWQNWVNAAPTYKIGDTQYKRADIFDAIKKGHQAEPGNDKAGKDIAVARLVGTQLFAKFGHDKKHLGLRNDHEVKCTLEELKGEKVEEHIKNLRGEKTPERVTLENRRSGGASEILRETAAGTLEHKDAETKEYLAAEQRGDTKKMDDMTVNAAQASAGVHVDDVAENENFKVGYHALSEKTHKGIDPMYVDGPAATAPQAAAQVGGKRATLKTLHQAPAAVVSKKIVATAGAKPNALAAHLGHQ